MIPFYGQDAEVCMYIERNGVKFRQLKAHLLLLLFFLPLNKIMLLNFARSGIHYTMSVTELVLGGGGGGRLCACIHISGLSGHSLYVLYMYVCVYVCYVCMYIQQTFFIIIIDLQYA